MLTNMNGTFPKAENKPFFVTYNKDKKYKVGEIVPFAPYNVKLQVLEVYNDNWFKRIFRKLGFHVRINQLKVVKTNQSLNR